MTRSQVRASIRRMKAHHEEIEEETGEINLVPYMDIVTNIIIFLLASVVNQVSLANVNVSLPTLAEAGAGGEDQPAPDKVPLNLTVTVGQSGFIVAASGGVLPAIPRLPTGPYDFKALTAKLAEIKAAPGNGEETKANFAADASISYDTVVETLDAMREDATGKMLFPDISFSAGII